MNSEGKCWVCGKPAVKAIRPNKTVVHVAPEKVQYGLARQFCDSCYEAHVAKTEQWDAEYRKLTCLRMVERAVVSMEQQSINLYEYKDVIEQMESYVVENPDKFDSSEEVIAAIILVGHGINCKPQYKVGKYKVDMLIPQHKIALEIDGERHRHKLYEDNKRDVAIRTLLGSDWEVVRIPIKYIDENAQQLIPAILQLKADKQKTRKTHGGAIPPHYSKRNNATVPTSSGLAEKYIVDE